MKSTKEQEIKLVITVAVLSKMQTNLEELVEENQFRYEHKQNANRVISSIDRLLSKVLKGLDIQALKELEQINNELDNFLED